MMRVSRDEVLHAIIGVWGYSDVDVFKNTVEENELCGEIVGLYDAVLAVEKLFDEKEGKQ